MKQKLFYAILLTLPLIVACSSDNTGNSSSAEEIHFTSQLQASATRGTTALQENQLAAGTAVYVWAENFGTNSEYFNAWELTADGNGGFIEPGVKYYPGANGKLNFYAIHYNGSFSHDTQTMPDNIIGHLHSVEVNQTTADAFTRSDLLYASMQEQGHMRSAVPLTFYHMLSKIEVALKAGENITAADLEGATIELMNGTSTLKTTVTFKPVKTTATAMAENLNNLRANMVGTENATTADRIGMPLPAITTDFSDFTEAILPPQTISGKFIKLTITSNSSKYKGLELFYTLNEAKTLQSGYKYRFNITVSPTVLTANSPTVSEWGNNTDTAVSF